MTELYNRRGFYKHFARMVAETSRKYAVLVSVDMNRLKYINDNYGHIEGDFAICTLAHAVREIAEMRLSVPGLAETSLTVLFLQMISQS